MTLTSAMFTRRVATTRHTTELDLATPRLVDNVSAPYPITCDVGGSQPLSPLANVTNSCEQVNSAGETNSRSMAVFSEARRIVGRPTTYSIFNAVAKGHSCFSVYVENLYLPIEHYVLHMSSTKTHCLVHL